MNILIITHHFPPENAMASLRPYSWAKYWNKFGHQVCVLTTQKELFDGPQTLELDCESFKVVALSYLSKQKSRTHSRLNPGKIASRRVRQQQFLKRLVLMSRRIRQATGTGALLSVRSLWIIPSVKTALRLHKGNPFDLVVSTYGPPAPHIIAGILKRRVSSLYWIADYRDLWNDYNAETRRWPFSTIEAQVERTFVKRSNLITTVSQPLCTILERKFNKRVISIENGFDISDLQLRRDNFFPKDGTVRLVYTGRVHSQKRDPSPLFSAIQKLLETGAATTENLEVLFYSNEIGILQKLIDDFGISKIVKIAGFVDRASSLSIQCSADALIFLDWNDPSIDGILTGKIFEYIFAGKPILGIGSDETRSAGRLIRDSGTGVCLGNSPDKIADVLL